MSFTFSPSARLLIISPHPDDESLGTGGLIQRMAQSGAAGRVLQVTNGDNNPWPQRWVEKRWNIGAQEQARWGEMRRREALAALEKLGHRGDIHFLNYPDQGLTNGLLRNDCALMESLCSSLKEWQPTCIVSPSPNDRHPDHNALHVLLQIALQRSALAGVRQFQFVIHCQQPDLIPNPAPLHLSEPERLCKYEAILCHKSQMILSRKRFLAYAKPEERYFEPASPQILLQNHPITEAFLYAGALHLSVTTPFGSFCNRGEVWIVGESAKGASVRWRLPLPGSSRKVRLQNTVTGQWQRHASVRMGGGCAQVKIPLAGMEPLNLLHVKYHRRTIFLDHSGWREVPLRAR